MMRPLKLLALSVALLACWLLLLVGTYCGLLFGFRLIGMEDPRPQGIAISVTVLGGILWGALLVWAFIEEVRRSGG